MTRNLLQTPNLGIETGVLREIRRKQANVAQMRDRQPHKFNLNHGFRGLHGLKICVIRATVESVVLDFFSVMQAAWAIVSMILIDIVLSGDNAVVIGMAARKLPQSQRKIAILFGGAAAIVLRILLTIGAALLLSVTGLRLIGGALLIWIGFKLLKEEEESEAGVKAAGSMREAVITILIADLIMSLDNVIGVAAASNGNLPLLIFGLVFSMAILMFMGNLLANLIDKFAWLAYAGSAVIVWTGATLIFEDPFILKRIDVATALKYAVAAVTTAGTVVFAHWFHRSN